MLVSENTVCQIIAFIEISMFSTQTPPKITKASQNFFINQQKNRVLYSQHYGWKNLPEQSPRLYHNCFLKGSEAKQCPRPIKACLETLSLVALGIKIGSKQPRNSTENGLEEAWFPLPALTKFTYLSCSQHPPFSHCRQQTLQRPCRNDLEKKHLYKTQKSVISS